MADQPNIFLIVLDTMRRDYIECYNPSVKTPNLMRLCQDSAIYLDAVAPSSWTIPSHASMFTGKYVSNHGVHETSESKRWEEMHERMRKLEARTLAEELRSIGYNTIGITANSYVGPATGFDRGFSHMMYNSGITDYLYSKLNDEVIRPLTSKVKGGRMEMLKRTLTLRMSPFEVLSYYLKYRYYIRRLREEGFPVRKDGDNVVRNLRNSSFESPAFFFLNFMEVHEPYRSLLEKYGANFRVFMRALFGHLI
ncbi:MAG: sulfatase-like hydrolase/transferase, partial [Nitrososphaeria archaeon]